MVAALVMMTRISIKVSLAWSTCAQMGFMMMQCGLGLYDLALLHLMAHSLYKAHAFLGAGGAVEQNRLQQMTPPPVRLSGAGWLLAALAGMALVAAAAGLGLQPEPSACVVGAGRHLVAGARPPLLYGPVLRAGGWWSLAGLVGAFAVALAYWPARRVQSLAGHRQHGGRTQLRADCLGAGLLWFVVHYSGCRARQPQGRLARGLYPWLFAGLYLDELSPA